MKENDTNKYFIPIPPHFWENADFVYIDTSGGNFYFKDGVRHTDYHYVNSHLIKDIQNKKVREVSKAELVLLLG